MQGLIYDLFDQPSSVSVCGSRDSPPDGAVSFRVCVASLCHPCIFYLNLASGPVVLPAAAVHRTPFVGLGLVFPALKSVALCFGVF